ncbi:restriction endonuclease subunit S [Thiohalobacter sp. IOR34]|uniref:restriction endonuclease subunit S n=1 Tax=Thiohalobacter sp. IOR34 TaxID=3057176 RepID=UPI0025B0A198|nr:restriction endonuclease subunit S [Thiohalobacter sp. IOR34]WJW75383.1 restriction endonuclease subunit S [Thiohalobacter sp. IOR34]
MSKENDFWREVQLNTLVDNEYPICYGILKPGKFFQGGVPVVKVKDITNGIIQTESLLLTDPQIENQYKRSRLNGGDILLSIRGTTGKVAIVPDLLKGANITQDTARIRISCDITKRYVLQVLRSDYVQTQIEKDKVGQAVKGINIRDVRKLSFLIPKTLSSRKKVTDLLEIWDAAIENTEKLIAAKEKRFSWLLSRLISDKSHPRGHIRDFSTEVSARNRDGAVKQVLSVTNHSGFVLPEDQFERRVASADLSNYKIVRRGQYAYNPSRINVGSIARLDDWDIGVLSPMYVVFELDEKRINSDFFLHWLSSHEARQRIKKSAQGSVRETVSFGDFAAIPFPLPSQEEQQAIARTLNIAQQEITILNDLADAYRQQKRGLMQKLLTGQWRVKS